MKLVFSAPPARRKRWSYRCPTLALLVLCCLSLLAPAQLRAQQSASTTLPQVEVLEPFQQSDAPQQLGRLEALGALTTLGTRPSAMANIATIVQTGTGNEAMLAQIGIGNETTLIQNGTDNVFDITLNGDRNRLLAAQIGNYNSYVLGYRGDDLTLASSLPSTGPFGAQAPLLSLQQGNGNQVVQLGTSARNPPFPVVQQGDNMRLIIRHNQ